MRVLYQDLGEGGWRKKEERWARFVAAGEGGRIIGIKVVILTTVIK